MGLLSSGTVVYVITRAKLRAVTSGASSTARPVGQVVRCGPASPAGRLRSIRRTPRRSPTRPSRPAIRGAVQTRPDDLDQAVVPVDDVPLRLGHQARPGTRPGPPDHPAGLRVGARATPRSATTSRAPMPASSNGPNTSTPARSASSGTPNGQSLLAPLSHRAIQIGLSGEAVDRYLHQWITAITDITPLAAQIQRHVSSGCLDAAQAQLPAERVYPLPPAIHRLIGATGLSATSPPGERQLSGTGCPQQPVQGPQGRLAPDLALDVVTACSACSASRHPAVPPRAPDRLDRQPHKLQSKSRSRQECHHAAFYKTSTAPAPAARPRARHQVHASFRASSADVYRPSRSTTNHGEAEQAHPITAIATPARPGRSTATSQQATAREPARPAASRTAVGRSSREPPDRPRPGTATTTWTSARSSDAAAPQAIMDSSDPVVE